MRIDRWMYTLPLRLRSIFRRRQVEQEMDDELRYHLESQIELHIAHGMSPEAARRAAMHAMGRLERHRDEMRDTRRVEWVAALIQDARYGLRLLARSPGFTAAALSTVALGIASTTVMFSVVYGVLLQPLPFKEPSRLVNIWATMHKVNLARANVTAANARDWRERNHVFEDVAIVRSIGNFNLAEGGEPLRLLGGRMTANLLPILGVTPMIGRGFTEQEDEVDHDNVVLLSHALWRARFASDSSIIGRTIQLSGLPFVVVGVMGPDFLYPSREFQLWVPLAIPAREYASRIGGNFRAVARLKPGVTVAQAQADLNAISAQLGREYPGTNNGIGADVISMLDDAVLRVKTPLVVLLGAVGALLLIGCANLANLLFVRALGRQREVSVRAALGASRFRLMTHSLGELLPILLVGAALGVVTAVATLRAIIPMLPADIPRIENVGLSLPVMGVAAGTLFLILVLAGLWPALEASRADLAASVGHLSRGTTGTWRRTRIRDGLVVAQIATTLLLFVGATVLMRSLIRVRAVDPGFDPRGVLSAHIAITRSKYPSDADVAAVSRRFMDELRGLPGVASVGMVNRLPLAGGAQIAGLEFEGVDASRGTIAVADLRTATPGYFATMRIPLRDGRVFTEGDDASAPSVALIDDQIATTVFGHTSPIGRRFRVAIKGQPWTTIVGVVGHVRHGGLDEGEDARPQVYWNYHQRTQDRMAFAIRTAGDPAMLARAATAAIRAVDPTQPVYDVRPLEDVVDRSLGQRWMQALVLGVFAGVALLLASIGVYGVIAYGVNQRLREFGVRMALGAGRGTIARIVLGRGARLFVTGSVIGLVGAAVSVRVLETLVFGVQPLDLPSFALATITLLVVGTTACLVPARRASSVDPNVALRSE